MSGFVEVSGYSSTDLQNKYNEGYGVGYEDGRDSMEFKKLSVIQNGTYRASDKDCDGFDEVEVNVAGNVGQKIITVNGDYNASDDGFSGYSKVVVNVSGGGGGGQHTVIFYAVDRTTILDRQVVEDGGGAIYHGTQPTANGMRFIGWSPNPVNVTADMNVYPKFENLSYDPTQITDDWITIANNVRRNPDYYNIGQWKLLELGSFETGGVNPMPASAVKMQLVGKNVDVLEGGNGYAPTSWVMSNDSSSVGGEFAANVTYRSGNDISWEQSDMRRILQTTFTGQAFPQDLLNYIRKVVKTSVTWVNNEVYTDYPTVDWFWQPSIHEIIGGATDYETYVRNKGGVDANRGELTGAVYDLFGKDDTVDNLAAYRQCAFWYSTRSVAWRPGVGRVEPWQINADGAVNIYGSSITPLRLGFCL